VPGGSNLLRRNPRKAGQNSTDVDSYKQSGIGRENHKMMLDHYQQTKNVLVSYSENKLGFF